jgi:drug/metabolite transporter (DMT)-like permease
LRTIGILLAFGMALCWAGSGIALQRPSQRMDVFLISGIRALSGFSFLLPTIFLAGLAQEIQRLTPSQWLYLFGSIVVGGMIGDVCYILGLRFIGMSRSFPIINSYPLFTIFYSIILLGRSIRVQTVMGALLVLAGVYCIARSGWGRGVSVVDRGEDHKSSALLGVALALAAAAAYGLEAIFISLGVGDVNGIVANAVRVPFMILFTFSVAGARGALRERRGVNRRTVASVALAGLFGWALAGSMWVSSIQIIGPSQAAVIGSTSPLFAVLLSVVILREEPTWWTLLGTLLTVGGVILVI